LGHGIAQHNAFEEVFVGELGTQGNQWLLSRLFLNLQTFFPSRFIEIHHGINMSSPTWKLCLIPGNLDQHPLELRGVAILQSQCMAKARLADFPGRSRPYHPWSSGLEYPVALADFVVYRCLPRPAHNLRQSRLSYNAGFHQFHGRVKPKGLWLFLTRKRGS
jgi:hypothetical protein